jgi:hypothetical protein
VLDKRELAAAVEQHQHQQQQQQQQGLLPVGGSNGSRGSETDATQEQMQRLGLDMAVLTTFARLLELKMVEMEGEGGTGSLESDLQQMADAAARENNSGNGAGTAAQLDGSLPTWQRNCVLYRAGQKALVRSYITAARVELQTTLAELQSLIGSDN